MFRELLLRLAGRKPVWYIEPEDEHPSQTLLRAASALTAPAYLLLRPATVPCVPADARRQSAQDASKPAL